MEIPEEAKYSLFCVTLGGAPLHSCLTTYVRSEVPEYVSKGFALKLTKYRELGMKEEIRVN
jgi:hypothetical protein